MEHEKKVEPDFNVTQHVAAVVWGTCAAFCLIGFLFGHGHLPIVMTLVLTIGWVMTKIIVEALVSFKALSERYGKK